MSFNPNDHMMKLKGRDYLQVAWRLVWFRDEHPDWSINTDILAQDGDHAIFKATISDENGIQKSCGHGSESQRDFGDYLEKAETKAVGRALAMLGYGTQFAADELDEGERIVDSPIDRTLKTAIKAPDAPAEHPKADRPATVTVESPDAIKARCINALKRNAAVSYGADAEKKLNELLTKFGVTFETMTSPIYKQINMIITKGESK